MGLFGELLSLPIKIVNIPLKAVEEVSDVPISAPLDAVSDFIEDIL